MTMKKPRNDANQNAYRQWLVKRSGAFMYEYLFEYLFEMPFESPIRRDKNRAEDGKYLRFIYQTDTNRNPGLSRNNDQCSVLEFLIALADATNELTEYTQSTRHWLQMFLDNTDLARYNDNFWTDGHENETVPIWQEPILQEVGSRVNRLLQRNYHRDGTGGGLFHIRNPRINMAKIEYWQQLQYWSLEHPVPDE